VEYELIRAILLDCFEDGWKKKNVQDARLYLQTYRELHPISFHLLLNAITLYLFTIVHTLWLEANYVIYKSARSLTILANQRKRLLYLSEHDLGEFIEALYEK
jgi:hypothetical protein